MEIGEALKAIRDWQGTGNYPGDRTFEAIETLITEVERIRNVKWPPKIYTKMNYPSPSDYRFGHNLGIDKCRAALEG